jgi:hypothetical protein
VLYIAYNKEDNMLFAGHNKCPSSWYVVIKFYSAAVVNLMTCLTLSS